MLVRPINLSLLYYVKDNVDLLALCPSNNCLYTNSKSTTLRPLKANLDTNYPDQNGQTPTEAPLAFYYRIDLIP